MSAQMKAMPKAAMKCRASPAARLDWHKDLMRNRDSRHGGAAVSRNSVLAAYGPELMNHGFSRPNLIR